MNHTNARSLKELRRQRLTVRLLRQTEDYLNAHCSDPRLAWPENADPKHNGPARGNGKPQPSPTNGSRVIDVRRLGVGTWKISLQAGSNGSFDNRRVQVAANQMSTFLDNLHAGHLIMDLGQIRSCTILLLNLIADVHKLLKGQNGCLALCHVSPPVLRLIQMSMLRELVHCYDSLEQALMGRTT